MHSRGSADAWRIGFVVSLCLCFGFLSLSLFVAKKSGLFFRFARSRIDKRLTVPRRKDSGRKVTLFVFAFLTYRSGWGGATVFRPVRPDLSPRPSSIEIF